MARKYFGTDGIRGRANGTITPELALKVGQAAGAAPGPNAKCSHVRYTIAIGG